MEKGLQLSELRRHEMNVWGAKVRTWMQLAPPAANTKYSSLAGQPWRKIYIITLPVVRMNTGLM